MSVQVLNPSQRTASPPPAGRADFGKAERDERHEHDDEAERCPACSAVMYVLETMRGAVACNDCDLALERELVAFLGYSEQVRAIRASRDK